MSDFGGETGACKRQPFSRELRPRICVDWITRLYRAILAVVRKAAKPDYLVPHGTPRKPAFHGFKPPSRSDIPSVAPNRK